jgi:hypothetical protein
MTEDRRWTTKDRGQTAERSSHRIHKAITQSLVTFLGSTDFVKFTEVFDPNGGISHCSQKPSQIQLLIRPCPLFQESSEGL